MKRMQGNGINLYEGYLQKSKREHGGKSAKLFTMLLPLLLLILVLGGFAGKILLDNREKNKELAALDEQIASLSAAYEETQTLAVHRDDVVTTYESLSAARFLFELYPAPTKELFTEVIDCADRIFNISEYEYNETTGILVIDASAASVNEVPQFVQRLRDTGLFSLVQYTGYTSNDSEQYFCTVGCTLADTGALEVGAALSAEEGDADTGSDTE